MPDSLSALFILYLKTLIYLQYPEPVSTPLKWRKALPQAIYISLVKNGSGKETIRLRKLHLCIKLVKAGGGVDKRFQLIPRVVVLMEKPIVFSWSLDPESLAPSLPAYLGYLREPLPLRTSQKDVEGRRWEKFLRPRALCFPGLASLHSACRKAGSFLPQVLLLPVLAESWLVCEPRKSNNFFSF